MPKLKEFLEEKKLEVLAQALSAEDIREMLTEELYRRRILSISNWGLGSGIITEEEFGAIISKIEKPREFPTNPEQRLEALLSVGNTEPKQVLSLLLMDNSQSVEALRSQFIGLIEGVLYRGKQWKPIVQTIEGYLVDSLDSIGFIAFSVIESSKIGYARTQGGKFYGQPVMAFMLNMANQLGISMYQLLGSTQTRGDSRAPYNRFRILEFLLSQYRNGKETREIDISNLLNLNSAGLIGHLNALKEIDFIEWDSISSELKGQIIYRWKEGKNPNEVSRYSITKNITRDVAEYLCQNKTSNNLVVVEYLKKKEHYKNREDESLLWTVNNTLAYLEKHGFAESNYRGTKVQSHVNLVRGIADIVEEFTIELRNAVNNGNELRAMEQLYNSYMADYDRFKHDSGAVRFYIDVSPQLNAITAEEAQRKIFSYLKEKVESRPKDMKEDLGFDVYPYLRKMFNNALIVERREGKKAFYSINPDYKPN